jgi:hypothetical protein
VAVIELPVIAFVPNWFVTPLTLLISLTILVLLVSTKDIRLPELKFVNVPGSHKSIKTLSSNGDEG